MSDKQFNPKLSIPGTGRPDQLEPINNNYANYVAECKLARIHPLEFHIFLRLNLILYNIQASSGVHYGFKR